MPAVLLYSCSTATVAICTTVLLYCYSSPQHMCYCTVVLLLVATTYVLFVLIDWRGLRLGVRSACIIIGSNRVPRFIVCAMAGFLRWPHGCDVLPIQYWNIQKTAWSTTVELRYSTTLYSEQDDGTNPLRNYYGGITLSHETLEPVMETRSVGTVTLKLVATKPKWHNPEESAWQKATCTDIDNGASASLNQLHGQIFWTTSVEQVADAHFDLTVFPGMSVSSQVCGFDGFEGGWMRIAWLIARYAHVLHCCDYRQWAGQVAVSNARVHTAKRPARKLVSQAGDMIPYGWCVVFPGGFASFASCSMF